MGKLLELILFGAGVTVGLVWFSTVILSFFYGIPKSTYHVVKGTLTGIAVLHYLFLFALWFSAFVGVVVLIAAYLPALDKILTQSQGFTAGQIIGVLYGLIRAVTKSGRTDLRDDFWSAMRRFAKVPIADLVAIPGDAMKIIGEYSEVLAENPSSPKLPYPKETIKHAIETALNEYGQ